MSGQHAEDSKLGVMSLEPEDGFPRDKFPRRKPFARKSALMILAAAVVLSVIALATGLGVYFGQKTAESVVAAASASLNVTEPTQPSIAPTTASMTPTNLPTIAPSTLVVSPTVAPTTQPTQSPNSLSPTDLPTLASPSTSPTASPPSMSPTISPSTLSPTITPCNTTERYRYDGRCNAFNNRSLGLSRRLTVDASLPSVANLSNRVFGHFSNVDRGRSKLSVLAVVYVRFFLSDVLEVLEKPGSMTSAYVAGCNANGVYGKISDSAENYQTPVLDLSQIFGSTIAGNARLKNNTNQGDLSFELVTSGAELEGLGHVMAGRSKRSNASNDREQVFMSGSQYSNVDHYSIYIHSRFVYLHRKFMQLLKQDLAVSSSNVVFSAADQLAVFESARLFVVMVAETIARDVALELGTFPVAGFELSLGIPPEFLLMSFADRIPATLPLYGDTNRSDDGMPGSAICALHGVEYDSTLYNITSVQNASLGADALSWVGYSAMFTVSHKGGSWPNGLRCASSWFGMHSGLPYDSVAAVIQRGRDHVFMTCEQYRASKGLARKTFADFGNALFAKQFAAQYSNNFSQVELSVCMLLDIEMRDRMMGSLIMTVLEAQNSSRLCNANGTTNFANSPVASLRSFSNISNSSMQLALVAGALCRLSPKIDLRGLAMANQLQFLSDNTIVNLGLVDDDLDRFIACTTANPLLAANSKFIPLRATIKEANSRFCNWAERDPFPAQPGLFLSNPGTCRIDKLSTTGDQTRRCFCLSRDDCSDRGVAANDKSCDCDVGYLRSRQANVFCERFSYPQTDFLGQFATNPVSSSQPTPGCSIYHSPMPPQIQTGYNIPTNYTSPFPKYCYEAVCGHYPGEGHYLTGGCNNVANPNLGRIYSTLGRVVPANYVNGISYHLEGEDEDLASKFAAEFPANFSLLPQNGLFRGFGKLLLDDVFKTSYVPMNESGMRTGSDASNPVQFQNMVTGWLDVSTIFPSPPNYESRVFNAITDTGSMDSYVTNLTDGAEMGMRTLFARRYAQTFSFFLSTAPCTERGRCSRGAISRCVREILFLEFSSIVREFLAEAKTMFPNKSFSFTNNTQFIIPVELEAAKIFDLHWGLPNISSCLTLTQNPIFDRPDNCIQQLQDTGLWVQRNLSELPAGEINRLVNQTKILGLGSLNAYLSKLNQPQRNYDELSDNLLFDLHGSMAEYAVNFGILEDILNRDQRNTKEIVYQICRENNRFDCGNDYTTFDRVLAFWIEPSSTRTLCGLLKDMSEAANLVYYGGFHPNMFRVGNNIGRC